MANSIVEDIKKIKESKKRKFEESIEIGINLKDVHMADPTNRINEEIILPAGRGKDIKVGIIASEEMRLKAKNADFTYSLEDLNNFTDDKKSFKKVVKNIDFFVAESTLMGNIGKNLGIILGPRGKMPKPMAPGQDPTPFIENLKKSVRARSRDKITFHVPVGTRSMSDNDLYTNINTVMKRVISHLDKGKGNIASAYIKSTMGSAVEINVGDIE